MSHLKAYVLPYENVSCEADRDEQRRSTLFYFILIPSSLQEKEQSFSTSIKETTAKVSTRQLSVFIFFQNI